MKTTAVIIHHNILLAFMQMLQCANKFFNRIGVSHYYEKQHESISFSLRPISYDRKYMSLENDLLSSYMKLYHSYLYGTSWVAIK